ncbi:MAG TPA: bifunctional precorrin-2 dehydrogenase/sirohydrochlorin ferrochelatase [Dehalococcoidia bacterium]|jgi:precorrin-2 dehydrogenase/sirohydrochlorin ferrochelatase|nr:bifunctional precorrin-2 dehydrogenase/sirohydrochlorin ferrochelatase [Dehalococcoidia bacterium]
MNKRDKLSDYYPIFLNISGKRCVVIGGGQVSLRKVKALLEHRASIEVISPDACPELNKLAKDGKISMLPRRYRAGDLKDAFIAIATTSDRGINFEIAREAQRKSVLVNVVDDQENSDFIAPSYIRRGDITIAVSTAGRSPALARKIRNRLEKDFGDEYASLARLTDEVRAEIKRQGIKVDGDGWQEALDLDLLIKLLREKGKEKAKAVLVSGLKKRQK